MRCFSLSCCVHNNNRAACARIKFSVCVSSSPRRVYPNFVASFDNAIGEKRGLQQKAQSEATSGMISSLFAYFFNPMNKKNINVMNERSLKKRESKVMFECV